jgi:repressor LexA
MIQFVYMGKNERTENQLRALRYLRNAIVHEGYSPSIRELAHEFGYKSPRTAFLIINDLIEQGWIKRKADGELQFLKDLETRDDHARTVEVPLVGNVACGTPLFAEENIEAYIPVSTVLAKPGGKYFFLRAVGDSMDAVGIEDGDLMLVRQQRQADNGQKVVALIDDEATVKELHREGGVVLLKPRSKNEAHKPIILDQDFIIQGVVVSSLPSTAY